MSRVGIIAATTRTPSDTVEPADDDLLVLPDDFPKLSEKVRHHRPDLLIVDPLTAFLGGGVDAHRDGGKGGIRSVLGPLAAMARNFNVTVLCLAHLNKGTGPPEHRIAGAAGIRNAARNLLILAPHPDAAVDDGDDGRRVLGHNKINGEVKAPTLDIRITGVPVVGDDGLPLLRADGTPATTSLAEVGGVSDVDYRDAFAAAAATPHAEPGGGGIAEAKAFLAQALADGPVPSAELVSDALGMGISERTLGRARSALGVVPIKVATRWMALLPREPGLLPGEHESSTNIVETPTPQRDSSSKAATDTGLAALADLAAATDVEVRS